MTSRLVPAEVRFWRKVQITESCWKWTGAINGYGYGIFFWDGSKYAHRLAYEMLVGPIPKGLHIDHLCRVRECVRPAHLEPVTPAVNALRGYGVCAQYARQTHCVNGHELSPENIYPSDRGWRICITCKRTQAAERYRLRRNSQLERV